MKSSVSAKSHLKNSLHIRVQVACQSTQDMLVGGGGGKIGKSGLGF